MGREHWKPWTRRIPTWALRVLLVVTSPLFFAFAAWDGGLKDGLDEWLAGWKECAVPRLPPSSETRQ